MIGYRQHIQNLHADSVTKAQDLARLFGAFRSEGFPEGCLIALKDELRKMDASIEALSAALPAGVGESSPNLNRHRHFLHYYLDRSNPEGCGDDALQIATVDLAGLWTLFQDWIDSNSVRDDEFERHVEALSHAGFSTDALRRAWAGFKTRLVERLQLDPSLDGERLVTAAFGSGGPAREKMINSDAEAYMNLLKGLYVLSRNDVMHNEAQVDHQQAEAVIALLSGVLARIQPQAPH